MPTKNFGIKRHSNVGRACGRILPVVFFVAAGCSSGGERALTITAEEFDAVQETGDDDFPTRGRADPAAPRITVEAPEPGSDVTTPFLVAVLFEPQEGAAIVVESLRVKYGLFDVTGRVTEYMSVDQSGITGRIDAVKPGGYKLRLSITDDRDRTGTATLRFQIVD